MEDKSVNARIRTLVKVYGHGNVSAFSRSINMGFQTVKNYISGRTPSYEFLSSILISYPYISAEWLMTGNGDMIKKEEPKQEPKNTNDIGLMRNKVLLHDIGEQLIKLSTTL